MPQATQQQLQALQIDLACPACEYNLRGLLGDVVNCPECGQECDIPKLIILQNELPWYIAPGLNDQVVPIVWLCFILFVDTVIGCAIGPGVFGYTLSVLVLSVGVVVWGRLMYMQWAKDNDWWAVRMSLMQHALFLGYIVGMVASFGGLLAMLNLMMEQDWWLILISGGILVGGVVLFRVCSKGERWVARQCIRRSVQQRVSGE